MEYLYRAVGLYPTRTAAESARDDLLLHGLAPQQMRLLAPGEAGAGADAVAHSDDVLNDVLRDGAIGAAAGAVAGAGASIALAAANLTLFIASPVLGALYLVGWGASLGGLVGAVIGSERSHGDASSPIKDALAAGQFVLVAHAATEAQTALAQRSYARSMGGGEPAPTVRLAAVHAIGPSTLPDPWPQHRRLRPSLRPSLQTQDPS